MEARNSIIVGSEKCSIAETQDKDFKTAIMNMFKDLKEDMKSA